MFEQSHKQDALKNLMASEYIFEENDPGEKKKSIYGEHAVLHIIENDNVEQAMKMLKYAADWYEHPHPHDRDHRGEVDFTAHALLSALYEPECYMKLTDEVKASIKRFYLEYDFRESLYLDAEIPISFLKIGHFFLNLSAFQPM